MRSTGPRQTAASASARCDRERGWDKNSTRCCVRKLFSRLCLPVALAIGASAASFSFAQDDTLKWVPDSSNAIAIVRVKELLASDFAKAEKWSDANRQAYTSGLTAAPPWASMVIRSTAFRPGSKDAATTYSLFVSDRTITIGEIARHEGVKAETLAGRPAVLSNRNAYFASLGPKLIGSVDPADRQAAARWIREGATDNSNPAITYLTQVAKDFPTAEMIIAVDLADTIAADNALKWLESLPEMAKGSDLGRTAELYSKLLGITLAVEVTNRIVGRLELDFAEDVPADLKDSAKTALFHFLADAGAEVENIQNASIKIEGKTLVMETPMDVNGFQRVLSLIRSPHPDVAGEQSASPNEVNGVATLNYYDTVVHIINNLTRQSRNSTSYEKTATWHEKFAQQIEQLPTQGVDPEVTAYGYETSKKLRSLANSLRGVPIEVNQLERSIRVDYNTTQVLSGATPFGYLYRPGLVNVQSNVNDVRSQQASVIAQDQADREKVWLMMRDDQNDIASRMSKKYNLQFQPPKY